jgi:hypothetical protein
MNREEIFRAIHKSGLGAYITYDSLVQLKYDECLERFATLIAAHAREECLEELIVSRAETSQNFCTQLDACGTTAIIDGSCVGPYPVEHYRKE